MKKIPAVIPARMASSRFSGKPLAKINGKCMIEWVYDHSCKARSLSEVYVATDHEDINSFCRGKGIPCIMTSADHKNCSERTSEVCQKIGAEMIVEIQGDEPTLKTEEIDTFVEKSIEEKKFDVAISYTDLATESADDPDIVKLVIDDNSRALFFSRSAIPMNFKNKEAYYYKQIGLYLWKAESLERFTLTPVGYLESIEDTHTLRLVENHFDTFMVYTAESTIGIDLPHHIPLAEALLPV